MEGTWLLVSSDEEGAVLEVEGAYSPAGGARACSWNTDGSPEESVAVEVATLPWS